MAWILIQLGSPKAKHSTGAEAQAGSLRCWTPTASRSSTVKHCVTVILERTVRILRTLSYKTARTFSGAGSEWLLDK